jgi:MFS family permease
LQQGFVSNDFTSNIIKEAKGEEWIGFVMTVFGVTDAIGSVVIGRLGDKFSKWVFVVIGGACCIAVDTFFIALLFAKGEDDTASFLSTNIYIFFIAAGVLGIVDSCWNTFPNVMMSVFFIENTETAFANQKFWQSIGSVCAFAWGPYLPFHYKCIIMLGVLSLAMFSITLLHFGVASIDAMDNNNDNTTDATQKSKINV